MASLLHFLVGILFEFSGLFLLYWILRQAKRRLPRELFWLLCLVSWVVFTFYIPTLLMTAAGEVGVMLGESDGILLSFTVPFYFIGVISIVIYALSRQQSGGVVGPVPKPPQK